MADILRRTPKVLCNSSKFSYSRVMTLMLNNYLLTESEVTESKVLNRGLAVKAERSRLRG